MLRTIIRRLVTTVVTLLACSILIFGYRYLIPGGPAADMADLSQLSAGSTPARLARQVSALKRRFGLDKPIVIQYYDWIDGVVHGHLGTSFYSSSSVTTVIGQRIAPSAELIIGALVISLLLGVPLGIYAAVRRDRPTGRMVLAISGLQTSVPDFWIATISAAVFGLVLHWFPAVGFVPLSADLGANLNTMILPILTLAIIPTAFIVRHMQSSLAHVLRSPYVRTGWAMGLPSRKMYFNWALRNALGPIVTLVPILASWLLGGTVLVEYIFNIPGLGTEIVTAVENQDYPMIQGLVLLAGVTVAMLNLVADLAVSVIDPRVREGTARSRSRVWPVDRRRGRSGEESATVVQVPMDAR